jgi:hypothetical protein
MQHNAASVAISYLALDASGRNIQPGGYVSLLALEFCK